MIRVSKSIVGKEEAKAVENLINNIGYLGMGSEVNLFERELEEFIDNKDYSCVCVNTGTSALHLAIESVTKPGDEVLVPAFTFIATYQAITAAGCIPISCDINKEDLLIDLKDAENRISNKTKVILPVLYASNPNGLNKVYDLAKKYKLRVIEDAAHAFGCFYNNKKIGAQGDIVCFSFDGIKNITSGEGGAIFSSDSNVIQYVKDSRLLGVINDTEKRFEGQRSWDFDVINQGYRYHMSNIFAAIGRIQLKRFNNEFSIKRKNLAKYYVEKLKFNTNIKLIEINYDEVTPHIFPVLIKNNKRNELMTLFSKNNIQYGMHYKPNHLLTKYKTKYNLKISEEVYNNILTLPLHPEITYKDIDLIINLIEKL